MIEPSWDGVPCPLPIPNDIAREVLREIFVESFCAELLLADIYFYEIKADIGDGELDNLEVTSRDEQNLKILNAIPELLDGPQLGFGAEEKDQLLQQRSIFALFRVVSGWTRT